jgi:hypothetical protein
MAKVCFVFLVKLFMIDNVNNGFPIPIMLLTETSATETKLLATEENRGSTDDANIRVYNRIMEASARNGVHPLI